MADEQVTPEQRTEAIRKAMATIIAEKVEATNREILTRRDDPETRIDDFAELMRDAGRNVGLLTAALGRVMVYDELLAMLREFGEGGPRTSHLIESYQRLMSQAKREAS
jgi:hypothetical protein